MSHMRNALPLSLYGRQQLLNQFKSRPTVSKQNQKGDSGVTLADLEPPWYQYPQGIPRYAAYIAHDPDRSSTIFRRFERLYAQNLLCMESELAQLEEELNRIDEEHINDIGWQRLNQDWNMMREYTETTNEKKIQDFERKLDFDSKTHKVAVRKVEIIIKLKGMLKQYYEALSLSSEVLQLYSPDRRSLKALRVQFDGKDPRAQSNSKMLDGAMEECLYQEQDLCVLSKPEKPDRLTRLFEGRLAFLFRKSDAGDPTDIVLHSRVSLVVTVIAILLSMVLLVGAILTLYWVKSPNARLGILCGFAVAFAFSLAALTNARRQDVFAATAAYGAVLVVFVSGDLANVGNANTTSSPLTPVPTTTQSTSQATATAHPNKGSLRLSDGAIAGVAIGCVGFLFLSLALLYCSLRPRYRRNRKSSEAREVLKQIKGYTKPAKIAV